MKDEIRRISQLVAEGKLSPEDAADLIEAFTASERGQVPPEAPRDPHGPPPPPPGAMRDPFRSLIDTIERVGKGAAENVNWQDLARTAKEGAKKSAEALKVALDEIGKGKINLNWLLTSETRDVTLPLAIPVGKTLKIDNPSGDVKIVGGRDIGSVAAHATFRGATIEEARQRAETYTLIIEESDHAVVIRQPDISGLSVNLELEVGSKVPIEIRSESGNVHVTDTGAGARLIVRSGHVSAKGLNGLIEIDSVSGDVVIEDTESAALSIESKSGNVTGTRLKGNLTARTANGNVKLAGLAAKTVSVEAVSGNIDAEFDESIIGSVNLRTVSGNALVGVASGGDYRVSLSTLRGNVKCSLEMTDEVKSDQRVTGRVGEGVGTLDVSAVTGNVTVEQRDAVGG